MGISLKEQLDFLLRMITKQISESLKQAQQNIFALQ
jgi:hypothetical protein